MWQNIYIYIKHHFKILYFPQYAIIDSKNQKLERSGKSENVNLDLKD